MASLTDNHLLSCSSFLFSLCWLVFEGFCLKEQVSWMYKLKKSGRVKVALLFDCIFLSMSNYSVTSVISAAKTPTNQSAEMWAQHCLSLISKLCKLMYEMTWSWLTAIVWFSIPSSSPHGEHMFAFIPHPRLWSNQRPLGSVRSSLSLITVCYNIYICFIKEDVGL